MMKKLATLMLALAMTIAPTAAFAQDAPGAVGKAKAEAVKAAHIANETALAAQAGEGKAAGIAKAAAAVQAAMARGHGNGKALGRGNAVRVLESVAAGVPPANGNAHGKAVSAAAKGLQALAGTNSNGNGWGRGGNPNDTDPDD